MKFMQKITLSVIISLALASGLSASQASSTKISNIAAEEEGASLLIDISPEPGAQNSNPSSSSSSSSLSETQGVCISIASPVEPATQHTAQSSSYSAYSTSSIEPTQQPTAESKRTQAASIESASVKIDVIDIDQNPLCAKIAQRNMTTVLQEKEKDIGDMAKEKDHFAWFEYWTKPITRPTEHDQLERAYAILASAEQSQKIAWTTKSIIEDTTWDDLNILCGSKKAPQIFLGAQIANEYIQTKLGQAFFTGLLARPTCDVTLLEARKAIIRELKDNEVLYKQVHELIKSLAEDEKFLTGLWGREQDMQFMMQGSFWSTNDAPWWYPSCFPQCSCFQKCTNTIAEYRNKNSVILEAGQVLGDAQTLLGVCSTLAAPFVLVATGFSAPSAMIPPLFEPFIPNWFAATGEIATGLYSGYRMKDQLKGMYVAAFCWKNFYRKRIGIIARYFKTMQTLSEVLAKTNIAKHFSFFKNIKQLLLAQSDKFL
jgi:hypothetical protein